MTRQRILKTRVIETAGGYDVIPVREGWVMGHPIGDPDHVWVRWSDGELKLMRTEEARKWVWR